MPFSDGPRHCGQFSALSTVVALNTIHTAVTTIRMRNPRLVRSRSWSFALLFSFYLLPYL
jgi:hypothetical protein